MQKKENIKIPEDYKEKLLVYRDYLNPYGCVLRFSFLPFLTTKRLNANAFFHKKVVASVRWAVDLSLFINTDIHNAFIITLGHELTHKEKRLPFPDTKTHYNWYLFRDKSKATQTHWLAGG